MQKHFIIVPLILSLSLASCGKNQKVTELIKQPTPVAQTETIETRTDEISKTEIMTGAISGTGTALNENTTATATGSIQFQIGTASGILSLPTEIWGAGNEIQSRQLILANDGWNVNTDLKVPPEGTNTTVWGIHISNSGGLANVDVANVDTVLSWIGKKESGYNETQKMFDGSSMYSFGFEGGGAVNISLLQSLQKSGISKVPEEDLQRTLVAGHSQPEKKIYSTKAIKNGNGEVIGYGSACSFSQDPGFTITFNSYCVLTFDGKYIKSYTYEIPMEFFKDVKDYNNTDAITSKYETAKTLFYLETKKFGGKMFNEMYVNNSEFKNYIDKIEGTVINNFHS